MKETHITFVRDVIDWAQIPKLNIAERVRPLESEATAYAQICYSEDALCIHLCATEPEIRKEETGVLGMPCNDSCLEFFFCPQEDDLRYFNFEFNPNGCLYLGFGSSVSNLVRLAISEPKKKELFAPEIALRENSWSICFRVPYSFIQQFFPCFVAAPGKTIRGNFYKCGDELSKPHYLAWNMIAREGKSLFHTPEQFGLLQFC